MGIFGLGGTSMSGGSGMTGGSSGGSTYQGSAGDIMGGVGAIAGAISGIVNAGLSYDAAQKQLGLEKRQLAYQKALQSQIFQREDTAASRRVLDLKSAGLSPVLAAGSAASAGPVVSTITPEIKPFQLPADTSNIVLSAMKMNADIEATKAQQKYIEQQAKKAEADTVGQQISNAQSAIDYKIQKETGMRSKPGLLGGTISDVTGALKGEASQKLKKYLKMTLPRELQGEDKESKGATGSW